MSARFPIDDTVGAWVPHGRFVIEPSSAGPLTSLAFAVKRCLRRGSACHRCRQSHLLVRPCEVLSRIANTTIL
jgi:hypothetical protein